MGRRPRQTAWTKTLPVLGLDVGGVLVDRAAENSDTSFFGRQPMETPSVADAFQCVAQLAPLFDHRVVLVSKAGPKIAALTREWLGRKHFFEITGISPSQVHFVRRRPDKAPLCATVGITHFVDDRPDVLAYLQTVRHRFLFLGGLGSTLPPQEASAAYVCARDWPALVRLVSATVFGEDGDLLMPHE